MTEEYIVQKNGDILFYDELGFCTVMTGNYASMYRTLRAKGISDIDACIYVLNVTEKIMGLKKEIK